MFLNSVNDVSEEDMKGCQEMVKMMETMVGDNWPKMAECLANAKSEDDADKCGEIMEKAAEELGEEMQQEMEKALEAEK